jgi:hypothetical protein
MITKAAKKKAKCMTPRCAGDTFCLGVCRRCYQTYVRLIRAGKTSWEKLRAAKRVLSPYANRQTPALRAFKQGSQNTTRI